jgi:hypothetical protein
MRRGQGGGIQMVKVAVKAMRSAKAVSTAMSARVAVSAVSDVEVRAAEAYRREETTHLHLTSSSATPPHNASSRTVKTTMAGWVLVAESMVVVAGIYAREAVAVFVRQQWRWQPSSYWSTVFSGYTQNY